MSSEGSASYTAPFKGITFEPIELRSIAPSIDRVVIKTEPGDQISLTVYTTGIYKGENFPLVTLVVERLLNRISFKYECQVGKVLCTGDSFPIRGANRNKVSKSLAQHWDQSPETLTLDSESQRDLKETLGMPEEARDEYRALYRVAISQEDSTSRFLLLYHLLLSICSDHQTAVDAQIKRITPDVIVTPSPHKQNETETIYTRLRNELAHKRAGTDPAETVREIASNVASFQNVVKQSITKMQPNG